MTTPNKKHLFVTGIGTDIGKTIVSAALVEKLQADYWKPVQSGDLQNSDSLKVKNLISNSRSFIFPESYKLTQPFSPHKSAAIDGITIEQGNIKAPITDNTLIIEGAGGLMVPLNDKFMIIDLIKELNAEAILVSTNYLGSINHTLLSIYALKQYGIPVKGIIFSGAKDIYSKEYILKYTGIPLLGHIPKYDNIDKSDIIDAGQPYQPVNVIGYILPNKEFAAPSCIQLFNHLMKNITVIGSGTMGNGIAHTFAQHGYKVALVDINEDALNKAIQTISNNLDRQVKKGLIDENAKSATLTNITTYTDLKAGAANANLVVEAATENRDIKLNLFKQLNEICGNDTILASNTSSISITQIAAATKNPDKVIGMHFMNPVPVMKLVEVIRGYATSDEVTATIMDLSRKLDKDPVEVNDYPGFVANRILMPMINEAIYTLFEGVAGVEEIDTVMKLGMAHPMGPLQLADFIGLDVCMAILKVLHDGFGDPKYAPCPLLVNMVAAGHLGAKSGVGFYRYIPGSKYLIVSPKFKH